MQEILQNLLNGIAVGAIYALIALGYTMVYGILKLINFAHGDVFMLGSFVGFYAGGYAARHLQTRAGRGWVYAGLVMLAPWSSADFGFLNERIAYRLLGNPGSPR
jgi:branched-chain amino acid transport system permease protein